MKRPYAALTCAVCGRQWPLHPTLVSDDLLPTVTCQPCVDAAQRKPSLSPTITVDGVTYVLMPSQREAPQ